MRARWDIWILMAVLAFAVWVAVKGAPMVQAAAEERVMRSHANE